MSVFITSIRFALFPMLIMLLWKSLLNPSNHYIEFFSSKCQVKHVLPYNGLPNDALSRLDSLKGSFQFVNIVCQESWCAGFVSQKHMMVYKPVIFFFARVYDSISKAQSIEPCFNIWQPCIIDSLLNNNHIIINTVIFQFMQRELGLQDPSSCIYLMYVPEAIIIDSIENEHYTTNYEVAPVVGEGIILCPNDSLLIVDEGFAGVVLDCKKPK